MSYIYKITNNVNQKIYIGKTNLTVSDGKNIVKILNENDMKNVHYMML